MLFKLSWLSALNPFSKKSDAMVSQALKPPQNDSEIGHRPTPENSLRHIYNQMWADPDLRAAILDIREMDHKDGRVKNIHGKTARKAIKGGLILSMSKTNEKVLRVWDEFQRKVGLDNPLKLQSDAKGLFMEGNLPYQWVVSAEGRIVGGIRMPSETIIPIVGVNGRFESVTKAYRQIEMYSGQILAEFAVYQLTLGRMDPDNFDDQGCMGRPYLDANREVWKKLTMTEEDLVLRRRVRAPLRMAHVLEGADDSTIEAYRAQVEGDQGSITTDFFLNKKGTVTAVQGDTNLDQIADVSYLLDTFFAGAPAPKGLFGYIEGLSRDILEDLKKDYFEEIDALQDALAWVYQQGFNLDLLLSGINPLDHKFTVSFAERRTETANQAADLGLKWQALGMPQDLIWRRLGNDPANVRAMLFQQAKRKDPYPDEANSLRPQAGTKAPRVSITPGNAPKGESATSISSAR